MHCGEYCDATRFHGEVMIPFRLKEKTAQGNIDFLHDLQNITVMKCKGYTHCTSYKKGKDDSRFFPHRVVFLSAAVAL